ncbi:MAG TPA: hypothetical protein VFR47_08545, partial [Anaerolineales bacterium]|nr:hypothetical protein [Anaerolineales bacterium]
GLLSLMFFLSGCVTAPVSTPGLTTQALTLRPSIVSTSTVTIPPTPTMASPTSITALYPFTPTFIPATLPSDLIVAYIVEDALWIWKQNSSQQLLQRQNISAVLSDDGQWILFRQRHISPDGSAPSDEIWVVRTNGSELTHLVGSDDLMALTGKKVLIDDFSWLPGQHEILFNTEEIIEGPPGSWPLFDLYSLRLSGQITQLLEPGEGGRFIPSPNGLHIALVTDSRIGILNLENGVQRTLLEFEPLEFPSDGGLRTPKVIWDPQSQFVITSIPPQKLYYPEEYKGEPEVVWRLSVNGQVESIAQWQPLARVSGIAPAPNLQYFFYLHNSCADGMGMLYVYNLTATAGYPLFCLWELPQWVPDGEHFIYEHEGLWQLGSISDITNQPLDVLNVPTDPNVHASPQLTWINDEYFLLVLRSSDVCTLNIAILPGVVKEIARTPPNVCPRSVDFSLSK